MFTTIVTRLLSLSLSLSLVQGGCPEPKWRWPSWDSAAPLRPLSCFHPNDGVVGSCGSGYSFRTQHPPSVPQSALLVACWSVCVAKRSIREHGYYLHHGPGISLEAVGLEGQGGCLWHCHLFVVGAALRMGGLLCKVWFFFYFLATVRLRGPWTPCAFHFWSGCGSALWSSFLKSSCLSSQL